MMKYTNLIILCLTLVVNFHSIAEESHFSSIKNILPKKVAELTGLDKKGVLKLWGTPQKKQENKFYYEYENYRYALILDFNEDNTIRRWRFVFVQTDQTLQSILSVLNQKNIKLSYSPDKGHAKGQYLQANLNKDKNSWKFIFYNNNRKTLRSITWEHKE